MYSRRDKLDRCLSNNLAFWNHEERSSASCRGLISSTQAEQLLRNFAERIVLSIENALELDVELGAAPLELVDAADPVNISWGWKVEFVDRLQSAGGHEEKNLGTLLIFPIRSSWKRLVAQHRQDILKPNNWKGLSATSNSGSDSSRRFSYYHSR
eukprot:TRINITY_DN609_c0_g3_i1.p1 TRINITY_DN609_c0_g3~~TRINITY_DN609_c0_g3_i1.p1  ORF type:complete len:155 (+),score=17.11 TRINITY_DN609_c0_g3_i1:958-1422(+)